MSTLHPERFLRALFDIAVESANPSQILPPPTAAADWSYTRVIGRKSRSLHGTRCGNPLWLGDHRISSDTLWAWR